MMLCVQDRDSVLKDKTFATTKKAKLARENNVVAEGYVSEDDDSTE